MAESDEIRARVAALIGNHTTGARNVYDGEPASVAQVLGAATVDEIATTVHDDVVAPLEARIERLERDADHYAKHLPYLSEALAERDDERAARRTAAESADRFRDVLSEALGYEDENPGDDVLVATLREQYGRTGPEPTRWRDFLTAARAQVDQIAAEPMRIQVIDLTEDGDETDG